MHPRNTLTFVKDDFQIGKNEERAQKSLWVLRK